MNGSNSPSTGRRRTLRGSGLLENDGPFSIVAMEKEVQASNMHEDGCGSMRAFLSQNDQDVVVASYSSALARAVSPVSFNQRTPFLLYVTTSFPSKPLPYFDEHDRQIVEKRLVHR